MMNAIVNVTNDWGIGKNGQLTVHLKKDMRHFKELTTGHPILLGRKTLLTFPRQEPLPNRENLILSTDPDFSVPGARVLHTMDAVFEATRRFDKDIFIVGGESVYRQFLPYCRKVYLTHTLLNVDSDAYFPNLDKLQNWKLIYQSPVYQENDISFQFCEFTNEAPARF